jgi:hypothetical protein
VVAVRRDVWQVLAPVRVLLPKCCPNASNAADAAKCCQMLPMLPMHIVPVWVIRVLLLCVFQRLSGACRAFECSFCDSPLRCSLRLDVLPFSPSEDLLVRLSRLGLHFHYFCIY